jgi:peptide deformylase
MIPQPHTADHADIPTILKMGHPRLHLPSESILALSHPETHIQLQAWAILLEKARAHYGGVGIAAPQIGIFKRMITFGFEKSLRYPDAPPIENTVLINPEWKPLSTTLHSAWEGCLSVPGLRGLVPRYAHIEYWGYDLQGTKIHRIVEDFHARLIQHEIDHLDGILFPQRIEDLRNFGFEEMLSAYKT